MTTVTVMRHRLDLHNSSFSFAADAAVYCGFSHVASGRICLPPARNAGACRLQHRRVLQVRPTATVIRPLGAPMPANAERSRCALSPAAVPTRFVLASGRGRRPRPRQAVIALATGLAALCVLLVGVLATSAAGHAGSSAQLVAAMTGPEQEAVLPVVLPSLQPGAAQQPVALAAVPSVFLLLAVAYIWLIRQRGQLSISRCIASSRPGRGPPPRRD
jgi:hypothetical protein